MMMDSLKIKQHLIFFFISSFLLFKFGQVQAGTCESPKYSSSGYSTSDGFFHYRTTYIMELALQCANNYQQQEGGQFYAVVNGKSYQAAVSEETSKYQVSWQQEHVDSSAQTFDVHIYDEDKFAEYIKLEQNGGDASSVSPLFTAQYYHPGVSKKAPLSSETVCLLLGAIAVYFALNFKQQLAKRD